VDVNVNLYEPGPSSTSAICAAIAEARIPTGEFHLRTARTENPAKLAGFPSKSAFLFGLSAGLLPLLLPRLLPGLLTLLILAALPALLRLAIVILIHYSNSKNNLNAHHPN
jgi:hypothetical protein